MFSMNLIFKLILICTLCMSVRAWDTDELEIFDLVEEINKNFYDFMGITQVSISRIDLSCLAKLLIVFIFLPECHN